MLRFLIIILCLYFLFRAFSRMFVVSSFNSFNRKMQDEMERRKNNSSGNRPEGHITIDPGANKNQRNNDSGEYVDYEEVK